MGQAEWVRAWIDKRGGPSDVLADITTCTVLADVGSRLGGTPVPPSVREAGLERQAEYLTRTLRDLSRSGCVRVAFLGVGRAPFAGELLGVLDKSVLEVTLAASPEVGALAPGHWERVVAEPIAAKPFGRWIRQRMEDAGVEIKKPMAQRIVEVAMPRSLDVFEFAGTVHRQAAPKGRVRDRDIDRALAMMVDRSDAVILGVWKTLSPLQQNLLRALAAGEKQIFAAAVRKRFGLRSTASVARSLELLGEKGLVEKALTEPGYAFENPWVGRWVEQRTLPDVGIHVDSP